mgnify:CR=1 FL=1
MYQVNASINTDKLHKEMDIHVSRRNEQTNFESGRVSGTEAEFRTGSGSGKYDA